MSEKKEVPALSDATKRIPCSDQDLADDYGLGRPGSEAARREPAYFSRNPHGFVGKPATR